MLNKLEKIYKLRLELIHLSKFATIKDIVDFILLLTRQDSCPSRETGLTIHCFPQNQQKLFAQEYQKLSELGMTRFSIRPTQLEFEVFKGGQGTPVVLLPPFNGNANAWTFQIQELIKDHTVIAFHYPGYGTQFDARYAKFEQIAQDIVAVLNIVAKQQKVHVVGWSLGGFVAAHLCLQNPEKVYSLTLVNTTAKLEESDSIENVLALMEKLGDDFSSYASNSTQSLDMNFIKANCGFQITFCYLNQVLASDNRKKVSNITVPTLIMSGANDKLTPPSYSEFLHKEIKNSEYHPLAGAGHYIPLFNAGYFNEKLRNFILQCEAKANKKIASSLFLSTSTNLSVTASSPHSIYSKEWSEENVASSTAASSTRLS